MKTTNILTHLPTKTLFAGLFTVVGVLGIGFAVGIATGVVNVPFAKACCIIVPPTPPPPPPPPPPPVPPVPVVVPTCTLSASPSSLPVGGGTSTLHWTSVAATSASIDQGVGAVSPVDGGSKDVSITSTIKYTLRVDGPGGETTCDTTITVSLPPPPPSKIAATCSGAPASGNIGDSFTWTAAPSGGVAPYTYSWSGENLAGTAITNIAKYTTAGTKYAAVRVTSSDGQSVTAHCSVNVIPPPNSPACTLAASPTSVNSGDHTTLSWTTTNVTSFSIDNGIGSVVPVASGSTSTPAISTNTTFTGTATGPGGTAHCTAPVTIVPPPNSPSCTLSASPTSVNSGDHTTLAWTTTHGATFSIDQGIGAVTPVAVGTTTSAAIATSTTFTGTVTSPTGQTATCTAAVTVHSGPTCSLTATPSSISAGSSATLDWSGSGIATVDIDHGVATAASSTGSAQVSPGIGSYTYTGTFHATDGETLTCTAALTVNGGGSGGGGCTSNCGGGGGGTFPHVLLSSLPHVNAQPLAYLYLSQIPYTGLDLGPVGTTLYWIALIGWSLALAYLVLFGILPFIARRMHLFGARVSTVLNTPAQDYAANHPELFPMIETPEPVPAIIPLSKPAVPAPAPAMPRVAPSPTATIPEAPRGYSSYEGFKSFAKEGALSIDDIVKGLSRSHTVAHEQDEDAALIADATPRASAFENVEPVEENIDPIVEEYAQITVIDTAAPSTGSIIGALVARDRTAIFAALRTHLSSGGKAEAFILNVVCSLDDVYRARIDGTPSDPAIAKACEKCDTKTLEKFIAALTTAIDSSYSEGVTGAKLALTRALAA